jgi:hypothetical protein
MAGWPHAGSSARPGVAPSQVLGDGTVVTSGFQYWD